MTHKLHKNGEAKRSVLNIIAYCIKVVFRPLLALLQILKTIFSNLILLPFISKAPVF